MNIAFNIFLLFASFIIMECTAWFMHKYVMHSFGWFLHKSHHVPHKGFWELNDLYPLVFAVPAFFLMFYGVRNFDWRFWVGSGLTLYGICYFIFHDIIVHRRFGKKMIPRNTYLLRIIRAHKIHHKSLGPKNAEAFGFLYCSNKLWKKMKKRLIHTPVRRTFIIEQMHTEVIYNNEDDNAVK